MSSNTPFVRWSAQRPLRMSSIRKQHNDLLGKEPRTTHCQQPQHSPSVVTELRCLSQCCVGCHNAVSARVDVL
eukprot:1156352-Pelagomonas_calceolata.AAC.6